mgnify:CR=1 FL=1
MGNAESVKGMENTPPLPVESIGCRYFNKADNVEEMLKIAKAKQQDSCMYCKDTEQWFIVKDPYEFAIPVPKYAITLNSELPRMPERDGPTKALGELLFKSQQKHVELANKVYYHNVTIQTYLERMMDALRGMWNKDVESYIIPKLQFGLDHLSNELPKELVNITENRAYVANIWGENITKLESDMNAYLKTHKPTNSVSKIQQRAWVKLMRVFTTLRDIARTNDLTPSEFKKKMKPLVAQWDTGANAVIQGWREGAKALKAQEAKINREFNEYYTVNKKKQKDAKWEKRKFEIREERRVKEERSAIEKSQRKVESDKKWKRKREETKDRGDDADDRWELDDLSKPSKFVPIDAAVRAEALVLKDDLPEDIEVTGRRGNTVRYIANWKTDTWELVT